MKNSSLFMGSANHYLFERTHHSLYPGPDVHTSLRGSLEDRGFADVPLTY
jgi:hypothetical protein